MSHNWLILTFSWLGTVSLQYINTGGPAAETVLDPLDSTLHYPLPYVHYFNLQPSRSEEPYQGEMQTYNQFYQHDEREQPPDLQRKRRTVQEEEDERSRRWLPNLVDTDQTAYIKNDDKLLGSPFILGFSGAMEDNTTDMMNILEPKEKKNFSPWGGKRSNSNVEHMWSWKRSANKREPNMPKRVRFSPWGGKRSGQMVLKPGTKGSKIIFSTTVPELTRIVSNFSPNGKRFDLAGFQFIPSLDKRHPIKILALSTNVNEKTLRDALPFKAFLESLPKIFKPGHPYADVNLKKDGKRKVKFSAWGGKRTPPIIGPIWTPAPQDIKESTLNTILLVRNAHENDETTKAF
uniref:Leucokinin n=1 Tax=Chilo suppressalis TaxID=168631 RepID=A0A0S1U0R3_CHISP|nr:leucokinin precursor [Chilo suppressalis]